MHDQLRTRRLGGALLGLAALAAAACADATPEQRALGPSAGPSLQLAGGEGARYMVKFKAGASQQLAPATVAASGGQVVDAIDGTGIIVLDGVTNAAALRSAPNVQMIEESITYSIPSGERLPDVFLADAAPPAGAPGASAPAAGTNPGAAPWYSSNRMWGMRRIEAAAAWSDADYKGGQGVNVCIIDSGIDATHPEFRRADGSSKIVKAQSFVPNANVVDSNFHGTHVAGTIAAQGVQAAGVAPDVNLFIAKVFAASGGAPTDRILQAVKWCGDEGADVVNMSLGGLRFNYNTASNAIEQGLYNEQIAKGVVFIVSAGNNNVRLPNTAIFYSPSGIQGVMNVGATGPTSKIPARPAPQWSTDGAIDFHPGQGVDARAYYSNYGTGVHVFAPGGRGGIPITFANVRPGLNFDAILSTCAAVACGSSGGYTLSSGTSMAAPHVTGLAALIRGQMAGTRSPAMRDRVMNCIKTTTVNIGPATTFGGGLVNVRQAYQAVKAGTC